MNASHLKNDALDVIEESPGTIHVGHFRVKLGPINESTRCLPAPCLIGFLGKKEMECSRCSAENAGQRVVQIVRFLRSRTNGTTAWDEGKGILGSWLMQT